MSLTGCRVELECGKRVQVPERRDVGHPCEAKVEPRQARPVAERRQIADAGRTQIQRRQAWQCREEIGNAIDVGQPDFEWRVEALEGCRPTARAACR